MCSGADETHRQRLLSVGQGSVCHGGQVGVDRGEDRGEDGVGGQPAGSDTLIIHSSEAVCGLGSDSR